MLKVIGVTKEGNAIVDTEGLCRVVCNPGAEVVVELVDAEEAQECAKIFNDCCTGRRAEIVTYETLAPRLEAV